MARDMSRYFLRVILLVGVCVIVGDARCKSVGAVATEQWQKTADAITALRSEPQTPATTKAIKVLSENQDALANCAREISSLKIEKAEASEAKYRWAGYALAIGFALGVAGSALARYLIRRFTGA